jgi:hypothetical protein
MKRNIILLFALLCFSNMSAQYKDAAAFDLKGNVKSCTVYGIDGKIEEQLSFTENGKREINPSKYIDIKRDRSNRLISYRYVTGDSVKDTDDNLCMLYLKDMWKYDQYGRLIKMKEDIESIDEEDTDDDIDEPIDDRRGTVYDYCDYNTQGLYTREVDSEYGTFYYKNFKVDSHGNWISRDRYKKGCMLYTSRRVITYWDNATSTNHSTPRLSANKTSATKPSDAQNRISATIRGTRVVYLLPVDNREGEAAFQANVTVKGAKGKDVSFRVYRFSRMMGEDIGITGLLCGSKTDNANYESTQWKQLTMRIPISQLKLQDGNASFSFIFCVYIDNQMVGKHIFTPCYAVVHDGNVESFTPQNENGVSGNYFE